MINGDILGILITNNWGYSWDIWNIYWGYRDIIDISSGKLT